MLCDVYFYPADRKESIEDEVRKEVDALRAFSRRIEADTDKYTAGIGLMRDIKDKFKGRPPFPVYAYTSKGPYLLQQQQWDSIIKNGARILLKGRFGEAVEADEINRGIREIKQNSWVFRTQRHFYTFFVTWGIGSAVIGWLLWKYL